MPEEMIYEIRVRGILDEKWLPFFSPFEMVFSGENTILTGGIHDQAELFGILLKIRDLGLALESVAQIR